MKIVTCKAPVNIAVIKYWGKRDEALILPINDSISSTLSIDHMCAKTTVIASPGFKENKFWLNGKEESIDNERLKNCLEEVKKRANPKLGDLLKWKLHIRSENNFPTAAGLASSAAGYACLVFTLAKIYELEGDISGIARRGSGSACRSVYGGWVLWHKGSLPDGQDSIATQIVPANHWPQMRIVILVVNESKKKYSSTSGMKTSVETSELLKYRADRVVPQRVEEMTRAIKERDFESFARITMQDSNQFHAICLDTFPPCVYLNDISHSIINLVHEYNKFEGSNKVGYTFDAGPNACLYVLEENVGKLLSLVTSVFPPLPADAGHYIQGIPATLDSSGQEILSKLGLTAQDPGRLRYIIHTKVGEGPEVLKESTDHLIGDDVNIA